MLPPLKNRFVEVVFVEMAGEDIDGFILLYEWRHDAIQVQPIVEY